MSVNVALGPVIRQRFFDSNGDPLAGGQLWSYVAGTTTPAVTYIDQSGVSANTNPIILDADGYCDLWLPAGSFKFVLQDSVGATIWTKDNISGLITDIATQINIAGALAISNNLSDVASATTAFKNISPMTTLGDVIYENATPTPTRLAGNTTTTKKFLTQTGTGSASAAPGWNTIAGADLPNPSSSTLGGVQSAATVSHQWIDSINTSGVPHLSQPAFTDISGSVAATQLPNPSATTLGGVQSAASVSHQWINSISTSGVPALSQPAIADLSSISNNTIVSNVSGGSAAPSANSVSAVIDSISSTQGSILYRGASTWSALAPGSSGSFLKTQGSSANPVWDTVSGSGTVTSVALTLPSGMSVTGSPVTTSGTLAITGFPYRPEVAKAHADTPYTIASTDYVVVADTSGGVLTLTLPTAASVAGKTYTIKLGTAGSLLTINTTSSQTIDGLTTYKMATKGDSIVVISDGSNWQLESFNINCNVSYDGVPTGTLTSSFNTSTFPTSETDPLSQYSGGTVTIIYAGTYLIGGQVATNGTYTVGTTLTQLAIFKGASQIRTGISSGLTTGTDITIVTPVAIKLAAGDTILFKTNTAATSPTFNGNGDRSFFSIVRVSN